jgi:hypothetical protein
MRSTKKKRKNPLRLKICLNPALILIKLLDPLAVDWYKVHVTTLTVEYD